MAKTMSDNTKKLIKGILITLGVLFIFRMGYWITLPYVNYKITDPVDFGFLNALSGGALGHFSLLALGISPYITSSIVIQLLQMDIIPTLKEWSEEGQEGKQKLNRLTRYVALILAFVQALTLTMGISINYASTYFTPSFGDVSPPILFMYLALVATAGTAFTLWLAEIITKKGVGNGTSMIICAGIIASFPQAIKDLTDKFIAKPDSKNIPVYALTLVVMILIIVFIVFMESAKRTIPVQYANRPSTAKFRGKNDSNIPVKLNSASVIPVIFASTLMSLPVVIVQMAGLMKQEGTSSYRVGYWLKQIFSTTSTTAEGAVSINAIGFVLYIVLIFLFSFFYTFLQMNPENMSKNLQKQNAFIPGVRPGEETTGYISKVIFKVTVIGATYLTIVATLPIIWSAIFDLPATVRVGGTGLIIIVGVALETAKQIRESKQERQYRGFLG